MSDSEIAQRFSLAGRVALVTGASSGLGAHFARVLAAAGASVVAAARRAEKLAALVEELRGAGHEARAVSLDVTDSASVNSALEEAIAHSGRIDVLVNNAGVADSRYCLNVDEDSWDFILETNLKGAWRMAKALSARWVEAAQPGCIVNTASILGLRVAFGESTYATSKAALIQLTRAMALELTRKQIRVNALCPGYFETEMNAAYLQTDEGQALVSRSPARRVGQLQELDGALLLLASDAGSFINGVALPVDGGHLVSSL